MKSQIQVIQVMRGLAALLVCCFHMKGLLPQNNIGLFLFKKGSIGVPLFFIISGFIMHITTAKIEWNKEKIKTFLLKRVIRIIPLYYLATLIYLLVTYQFQLYIIEQPTLILPSIFFFPTYANLIGPSYGMPVLKVGWSLNYEMYFYLLLAISLLFKKYRWHFFTAIIFITVIIIPLISKGYVMKELTQCYTFHFSYLSLITNPVLLFFVLGITIGKLYQANLNFNKLSWAKFFVFAALINFTGYYFNFYVLFNGYFTHLFNCGILFIAILLRNKLNPYKIPNFLIFLGDISFSLYLIHPIVLFSFPIFIRQIGLSMPLNGWVYFVICLLLIVILSSISYFIIEKRLSRFLMQLFLKEKVNSSLNS